MICLRGEDSHTLGVHLRTRLAHIPLVGRNDYMICYPMRATSYSYNSPFCVRTLYTTARAHVPPQQHHTTRRQLTATISAIPNDNVDRGLRTEQKGIRDAGGGGRGRGGGAAGKAKRCLVQLLYNEATKPKGYIGEVKKSLFKWSEGSPWRQLHAPAYRRRGSDATRNAS